MLWQEQVQMFGLDDALLPELNTGKEAIGLALKSQFSVLLENLNATNTDEAVRKAIEEMWKWLESVKLWGYEHYLTDEEPRAEAAVCNAYKRGFSYLDANCRAASEHCEKRSLLLTFGELLGEAEVVCLDVDSDINIDNFCDYIMPSFINSVSIVKDDIRPIIIGEEIEVHATVENVDKQPLNLPVTWGVVEVSVADIVEVVNDNTVRIRGVGEGKATLAVNVFECDTRFVDEVEIEVQAPSPSVKLNTEEATLSIGDTLELTAEMIDADGNPLQGYTFTWSSSNPDVASINPESGSSTLVSADSKGIATITATCEGVSGSADITVIEQQVSSVKIYSNAPTIKQGQTLPLTVKIFDTAMTEIECPSDIVWEIPPNESIAFDLATVTGVTPGGPVTITATCGGVSDSAEITVINQDISVLLSPPSITLERHQQQGLWLWINSDGTWRVCPDPEWTIPPGQVILFDPINQYVTGNYPGIATIYAACEGVTVGANITVPGWRIKWKTSSFATGECEITFPDVYNFVSKESKGTWEGFALIATDGEIVEGEHSGSGYRHKYDNVIGECESTEDNIDAGWSSTQTSNFVSAEWYMNVVEVDGKTYIKDPFLFGPWPPFEIEFTTSSTQHRWGYIRLCDDPQPVDWTLNSAETVTASFDILVEEEQYLDLVFEDYNPPLFFREYFVYPGDIEAANASATIFSKKFSYQYGTLFFPSSGCTAPVTYTWDITIVRVGY